LVEFEAENPGLEVLEEEIPEDEDIEVYRKD
jgi:hypothetical protein